MDVKREPLKLIIRLTLKKCGYKFHNEENSFFIEEISLNSELTAHYIMCDDSDGMKNSSMCERRGRNHKLNRQAYGS